MSVSIPCGKCAAEATTVDLSAQAVSVRHAAHSGDADDGRLADSRDSRCRTMSHADGVRWGLRAVPEAESVSAENDVGWIPNWVHRLDHVHDKVANAKQLPLKPSDYVRRNVWATFQDDPLGPATWKFFGERNYMWASDFPTRTRRFPSRCK